MSKSSNAHQRMKELEAVIVNLNAEVMRLRQENVELVTEIVKLRRPKQITMWDRLEPVQEPIGAKNS